MKKIYSILSLALMSSTVFAGSYDFDCIAYHLDEESGQISRLIMNRDESYLDDYPGISMQISDPNIDLTKGVQTYENEQKKIVLKATVVPNKNIAELYGNIGRRDHVVKMNTVDIKLSINGSVKNYVGSCTETTITTCGGPCD